jgi:hypothetical protein
MMGRSVISLIVFLMVCAATVSAQTTYSSSISTLKNQIFANESALFKLTIHNPSSRIEQFSIYTPDVEWSLATIPSRAYILKVYPYALSDTLIEITPSTFTESGVYGITINAKALGGNELLSKKVVVEILSERPVMGEYLPSVHIAATLPEEVDPREQFTIRVDLVNQNPLNISELDLKVGSQLISRSYKTNLGALESKSVDFTIALEPDQPPVEDTLRVSASTRRADKLYQFEAFPVLYRVVEYGTVTEEAQKEGHLLKTTTVYKLTNTGNSQKQYTLRVKRNLLLAPITSFSPEPAVEEIEGSKQYVWRFVLEPKQQADVRKTVNYWPPVMTAAAVIIILVFYFWLRSPIVVVKSSQVLSVKHGGISELTIQIDVRNRSKTSLHNVKLIDKLPNLLDLKKEKGVGVVVPDKVLTHEKKGTILKWNMGSLEPFEERLITYKTVSKLSILGGLSLPVSIVKYDQDGAEGSTRSNVLYLKT